MVSLWDRLWLVPDSLIVNRIQDLYTPTCFSNWWRLYVLILLLRIVLLILSNVDMSWNLVISCVSYSSLEARSVYIDVQCIARAWALRNLRTIARGDHVHAAGWVRQSRAISILSFSCLRLLPSHVRGDSGSVEVEVTRLKQYVVICHDFDSLTWDSAAGRLVPNLICQLSRHLSHMEGGWYIWRPFHCVHRSVLLESVKCVQKYLIVFESACARRLVPQSASLLRTATDRKFIRVYWRFVKIFCTRFLHGHSQISTLLCLLFVSPMTHINSRRFFR